MIVYPRDNVLDCSSISGTANFTGFFRNRSVPRLTELRELAMHGAIAGDGCSRKFSFAWSATSFSSVLATNGGKATTYRGI